MYLKIFIREDLKSISLIKISALLIEECIFTQEKYALFAFSFYHLRVVLVHFSSVAQLCPTLLDPIDCSTPGFPVHHQLLELAQTHVRRVSDVIQPSHPLSSPFLPAFNLSQHQGLFQWVSSSHKVARVLELKLQHQSFQWIFRTDFLKDWLVGSPCSPRDSQESSPPQFKTINSLRSAFFMIQLSHPYMATGKTIAMTRRTFVGKIMSRFFLDIWNTALFWF